MSQDFFVYFLVVEKNGLLLEQWRQGYYRWIFTSRLDYCNSVIAGLPQSTLDPLQRLQNAAARVIFNVGKQEHVSPYLEQLHWLPVRARVQFKLCTVMHAIHNKRCPAYLADVQLVGMASTRTSLRSADSSNYSLPGLNTRVGECAFSYAGPAAWNQLPESISQLQTTSFKHKLKTFLFTQCYNSADWLCLSVISPLILALLTM